MANYQIKELAHSCKLKETFSPHWDKIAAAILNGKKDIHIGNFRFIKSSVIDDIQVREIVAETRIIATFHPYLISKALNVSLPEAKAMKDAETNQDLDALLTPAVSAIHEQELKSLGYGNHFANLVDYQENHLNIDEERWYYFSTLEKAGY